MTIHARLVLREPSPVTQHPLAADPIGQRAEPGRADEARYRGVVVTRDQLVHEVWGPGSDQADHVRVHIAALRKKIEHIDWMRSVIGNAIAPTTL